MVYLLGSTLCAHLSAASLFPDSKLKSYINIKGPVGRIKEDLLPHCVSNSVYSPETKNQCVFVTFE